MSDFEARLAKYNAEVAAEREAIRLATPEGYRLAFGVPYARVVMSGRAQGQECPRCGKVIISRKRKDFESFTGSEYAEHYDAEHAAADGRIFVAGRWWEPVE